MAKRRFFILVTYVYLACMGNISQAAEQITAHNAAIFGQAAVDAPPAVRDYQEMIGISDCVSQRRGADGEFAQPAKAIWQFKYILNGTAVQDETFKDDGSATSSIRQYNQQEDRWYVTYFASNNANPNPQTWVGGKISSGDIELSKEQPAPNGMQGFSRLTFTNINERGFSWQGEWVAKDDTYRQVFWKIDCKKRED